MDLIAAPFGWLLRQLLSLTGNYGISIILFALLMKVLMLPFTMQSKKGTMRMQRLAPYVKDLEKKYAGNERKYQEEVSALYKEENLKPMSGCLWALLPFPVLMALLSIVRMPLTRLMGLSTLQFNLITDKLVSMGVLEIPEKIGSYFEVQVANLVHLNFDVISQIAPNIIDINFNFFGLNLAEIPQWNFFLNRELVQNGGFFPALLMFLIPVVSAALTFVQMKIASSAQPAPNPNQPGAPNMDSMMYTMPVVSLVMGYTLPAAMGIYWMVGYIWSIPETILSNNYFNKRLDAEDSERIERLRKKEDELEQKRLETERLKAEGRMERNRNTSKRKLQTSERTKEEERVAAQKIDEQELNAQVDDRKYARGRAYLEDRYTDPDLLDENMEVYDIDEKKSGETDGADKPDGEQAAAEDVEEYEM